MEGIGVGASEEGARWGYDPRAPLALVVVVSPYGVPPENRKEREKETVGLH